MKRFLISLIPHRGIRRSLLRQLENGYPDTLPKLPEMPAVNFFENDFPNYLSIVLIIKNESHLMPEWLEYHIMMGVDKFYIYDNESTDNLKDVLTPYIRDGIVEYFLWPDDPEKIVKDNFRTTPQVLAYNDAVNRFRDRTKWMAFIDADEFITPIKHANLKDFLHDFDKIGVAEIVLFWKNYCSSGHLLEPDGLMCENFRFAEYGIPEVKSIVNPRATISANMHTHAVTGPAVMEDLFLYRNDGKRNLGPWKANIACISHYYTRSVQGYMNKKKRGDMLDKITDESFLGAARFHQYDSKAITYDDTMVKHAPAIRQAIKARAESHTLSKPK